MCVWTELKEAWAGRERDWDQAYLAGLLGLRMGTGASMRVRNAYRGVLRGVCNIPGADSLSLSVSVGMGLLSLSSLSIFLFLKSLR
ncbi:uncharacterized protein CCOS01_13977 [Colletotrichum costaricense]|uniref:Uncharacterized protein n=1 Tax=Colletotrichum costaricense TaxID=1209916 RepID=A0AAI9YK92_9PEZI|nr:uncharacterized protein CCOS01_13977 [Colletotrichum costaricense]KAK1514037.1 hypothetical protein CCOS01_13977 [Colletotrichum costaricense]